MGKLFIPIDEKFGRLRVIGDGGRINNRVLWKCICECGKEVIRRSNSIKSGNTQSCGCLRQENSIRMREKINEIQREEIYSLYRKGFSSYDISKKFDVYPETIIKILKKHNEIIRKRKDYHKWGILQDIFSIPSRDRDYWVGFLAADGGVCKNYVRMGLHEKDKKHLYKFRDFLGTNQPIKTRSDGYPWIDIGCKKIVEDLALFNIIEKKTFVFEPIEEHRFNSDFWRGMIDGDGSVSFDRRDGKLILLLVGNEQTLYHFLSWVRTITNTKASVNSHSSIFRVGLYGTHANAVASALYDDAPVYLDRKYQTYLQHKS